MTLSDVKDYLKAHIDCGRWYVGKIDGNQEQCIGIYPTAPPAPVIAIGGVKNTSYAMKAVSVLIHWGSSSTPAEEKAQEVFDLLYGQNPVIGGKEVVMIDFRTAEPMGVGTDSKGIYEYVINCVIYFRKGQVKI